MKSKLPNYQALNSGKARKIDAILVVGTILYGLYRVFVEWPDPTNWSWGALAFGALAAVCYVLKPADIVMNMFVRSVVKTRD